MHFRSTCCSETVKFLFRENCWEREKEQEQGNYTALDGGLDGVGRVFVYLFIYPFVLNIFKQVGSGNCDISY